MIELFEATKGDLWERSDKWDIAARSSPYVPGPDWYGVRTKDGHVIELDLHGNKLGGTCEPLTRPTHVPSITGSCAQAICLRRLAWLNWSRSTCSSMISQARTVPATTCADCATFILCVQAGYRRSAS